MNKRILMRIDFQNDFVHPYGALTLSNPELIGRQQKFANSLFLKSFDKIIDTYDTHFAETYANTKEAQSFPPHCIFASWGWQSAAPFNPELKVQKMYKSTTNIWNEANNYQDLSDDWRGKELFLCGVLSDVCVEQAMSGALKRGAKVVLLTDLCQGQNRQINDIMQEEKYRPWVEQKKLSAITTAQFFQQILNNKKILYTRFNQARGE